MFFLEAYIRLQFSMRRALDQDPLRRVLDQDPLRKALDQDPLISLAKKRISVRRKAHRHFLLGTHCMVPAHEQ